MKILLTGATGYIGKRLLPVLLEQGHEVICCVRNKDRFTVPKNQPNVRVFEVDFLQPVDVSRAPKDIDVAYYLIHSMSAAIDDFEELEERSATHFRNYIDQTRARQVIYLTGMVNEDRLSRHLRSRLQVEQILGSGRVPLTALRAGIVIGSGSASFEIIRDLVEKLPVMVAPKWLNTKCQPIAIGDVIRFLTGVMLRQECYHQDYDIGCREVLTYKEMLLGYAEVRRLRRLIITLPVLTPRLSSYWLYFVTSTTYELAVNLVNSMKVDVVARDLRLAGLLGIEPLSYRESVRLGFQKIEQQVVISSWKDSLVSSSDLSSLSQYINVPEYGVFEDRKSLAIELEQVDPVWENICSIGGERGWYYGNFLWQLRGLLDKFFGGIGLRRGRTNPDRINPGDALDFWRVLLIDNEEKRLLLYAEMKLPGEAWLEFRIEPQEAKPVLHQTATFRPNGLFGRIYWYSVLPFHYFIFNGMIRNLARYRQKQEYAR